MNSGQGLYATYREIRKTVRKTNKNSGQGLYATYREIRKTV